MADNRGMKGSRSIGFQFSAAGAVIMLILYILQITETAPFFLTPSVTLSIAAVAAIGAILFYYSKSGSM
jgi:hypothetical protein